MQQREALMLLGHSFPPGDLAGNPSPTGTTAVRDILALIDDVVSSDGPESLDAPCQTIGYVQPGCVHPTRRMRLAEMRERLAGQEDHGTVVLPSLRAYSVRAVQVLVAVLGEDEVRNRLTSGWR